MATRRIKQVKKSITAKFITSHKKRLSNLSGSKVVYKAGKLKGRGNGRNR